MQNVQLFMRVSCLADSSTLELRRYTMAGSMELVCVCAQGFYFEGD
jgi:hypothetical protein